MKNMLKAQEGGGNIPESQEKTGEKTILKQTSKNVDNVISNIHWTENYFEDKGLIKILSNRLSETIRLNGFDNHFWGIKTKKQGEQIIVEHSRGGSLIWNSLDDLQSGEISPEVKTKQEDKIWPKARQLSVFIEALEHSLRLNEWWIK